MNLRILPHAPMRPLARFTALALLTLAIMCGPAVAQAHALDMIVGQHYDAAADASGNSATYKSSKGSIASVSKNGTIKAKKAGKANITVKADGKKKTIKVTVYAKSSSASGLPKQITCPTVRQTANNTLKLSWSKKSGITGYVVYKKSGSKHIPVRLVKGAGKTNTTFKNLTANSTQKYYVCTYKKVKQGKQYVLKLSKKSLTVSSLVTDESSAKTNASGISFGRNQVTIVGKGSGEALASVKLVDSSKKPVSQKIRYTVSNPAAASVSSDGTITIKTKKKTTCKVTAWAHNGAHKSITVNIVPALRANAGTFIAHRGEQEVAPDNTIAAFTKAEQEGYKTVELDVWETYSGDLVVNHDKRLKKMCGVNLDVRKLTCDPNSEYYVENYRITAGSNLKKYGTMTVLSFKSAVKLTSALSLNLVVHLKNPESDPISEKGIEQLVATLDKYDRRSSTTVTSHLLPTLQMVQDAGVRKTQLCLTSASGYDTTGKGYAYEIKRAARDAQAAGCTGISVPWKSNRPLDASTVKYCHKQGVNVGAWTIGSKRTACRLLDIGVDSLTCSKKLFG